MNLARTYDLANATAIDFKTDAGGNGTIADPARVRAFATALDTTLPTTQVVVQRDTRLTRYYLHFRFERSSVSLEYDSGNGVLSVLADGCSVRPGPDFAALIARIP